MMQKPTDPAIDRSVLLALLMLVIFASPLTQWWASSGLPWIAPYLFWLLIIVLTALARYWDRRH